MAAHVDVAKPLTAHRLREGLNALVRPQPVTVREAEPVADDWHARFSCVGPALPLSHPQPQGAPALDHGRVWHVPVPLDVEAMRAGAAMLVGRHDSRPSARSIASRTVR
jgi:tRNA pseudouridine38-40 synthase